MSSEIIYEEDCPVTVVKVENGYKVIQSNDFHAYNRDYIESHAASLRTGEYVFSSLVEVYEFLNKHFNRTEETP